LSAARKLLSSFDRRRRIRTGGSRYEAIYTGASQAVIRVRPGRDAHECLPPRFTCDSALASAMMGDDLHRRQSNDPPLKHGTAPQMPPRVFARLLGSLNSFSSRRRVFVGWNTLEPLRNPGIITTDRAENDPIITTHRARNDTDRPSPGLLRSLSWTWARADRSDMLDGRPSGFSQAVSGVQPRT
jgi:hypothetical protein